MSKILSILALCLIGTVAHAQTYNLFKPANGILKGATSTYVTTAAASSDVISLWTGTCSSTTFLRGDGQCQTPSGAGIGTVTSVALDVSALGLSVSGSPVTSSGTLTVTGTVNVAHGGTGATTLTGLLEGNGTGAIDPAESADVITLWTGTCNSTTFLRGDGSCQGVPGNTDASTLTTGTLADARLSANVPLKNAANTFTAIQTVSVAPSSAGQLALRGVATGATNQAFVTFNDSAGGRKGYVGDDNTVDSAIVLANDTSGADVVLQPGSGGVARVSANTILTTVSSLNGSNVSSGTVAAARLPTGVAYKDSANQTFIVVGNNNLTVANGSTGFALLSLETNGIHRFDVCSATSNGTCSSGDAANDSSLRFSQKLILSDNNGANPVAGFDTAQIDLNATAVNANGSRINTIANTGRVAYGAINGTTGACTSSLNVTSCSRSTTGTYSVDTTAAGFTGQPICTANTPQGFIPVGASSGVGSPFVQFQTYNVVAAAAQDINVTFVCRGN